MTLETVFLVLLAMAVGSLFPIQAAANAELGGLIGGPIAATTVSFTVGWLVLVAINAVAFHQFPRVGDMLAAPLWLVLVGGAIGAAFLSANVYIAPMLGAAATLCFVIAGQIASALLIDRLGLFGFDVRHLSAGRVVGALLVLGGAALVRLT